MPPGPPHRPQTLKQAKKAYRKSGATVHLSDSEKALIERRAVLQERADRIREREARRKANMKKKEERNQKEREVRQRMNLPSPTKGGFHVGPSQLHLGDFMVMGGKRKREEAPSIYGKVGDSGLMNTESKSCQASPGSPGSPQSRTPLQEVSANTMTKVEPRKTIDDSEQSEQDIEEPQKIPTEVVPPTHSCSTPQLPSTKPSALSSPVAKSGALKVDDQRGKAIKPDEPLPMGPPPLPCPSKTKSAPPTTHQARSILGSQSQGNPPEIALDPWDDFFVSNTQIIREISLPVPPQAPKPATPTKSPSSPFLPSRNETIPLLSHFSTQDLDTSDLLTQPPPAAATTPTPSKTPFDTTTATTTTPISSLLLQISTQDLDFSSPSPSTPSKSQQRKGTSSSEFNEDVTEEDLQDLVLEYEMQSSWRPKGQNQAAERQGAGDGEAEDDREKTYTYDDTDPFDSELSTQDWRELGIECG